MAARCKTNDSHRQKEEEEVRGGTKNTELRK
jgi:hypothetical protein